MKITTQLTIDLAKRQILEKVDAVQCDANTRAVVVTLTAGGLPWVPGDGLSVSVACEKPDRTSAWYDTLPDGAAACSVTDNVVTAILAPEVLTAAGQVKAAIVFQNDRLDQLTSFPFIIAVEENPAAGNKLSNSYYNLQTLGQINEAIATLNQTVKDLAVSVGAALQGMIDDTSVGGKAWSSRKIVESLKTTAILCTAEGESIAVSDAAAYPLQGLTVYGKSVQDGVGTPDAPVPIVSAGAESGVINVQLRDKPLIAEQPKDASVDLGAEVVFTVKAFGKGLTYQWQYNDREAEDAWAKTGALGADTDTLRLVADESRADNKYRCVIKDADGNVINSRAAYLLVVKTDAVAISAQPSTQTVKKNEYAVFTVEATDADGCLSMFQWQYTDNSSAWINTSNPGFDTDTLTVQGLDYRNGYKYRCVITDGNGAVIYSKPATLIVGEVPEAEDDFPEDAQVLTIPTLNGLPGLPVSSGGNYTDENGQMYAANCRNYHTDKEDQRVAKIVFDGSDDEVWKYDTNYNYAYIALDNARYGDNDDVLVVSTHARGVSYNQRNQTTPVCHMTSTAPTMYFRYMGCQSKDEWIQFLKENPVTVLYVMAEPVEQDIPEAERVDLSDLHTYKPNTTIVNDAGAGMKVEYVADPKTYIDNQFAQLATAMAGS